MKKFLIGALVVAALAVIVVASIRKSRGQKGTRVHVDAASRQELGQIADALVRLAAAARKHVEARLVAARGGRLRDAVVGEVEVEVGGSHVERGSLL